MKRFQHTKKIMYIYICFFCDDCIVLFWFFCKFVGKYLIYDL